MRSIYLSKISHLNIQNVILNGTSNYETSGGIYLFDCTSITILYSNFSNLVNVGSGGAIQIEPKISCILTETISINITNCTFNNNSATVNGGGISI